MARPQIGQCQFDTPPGELCWASDSGYPGGGVGWQWSGMPLSPAGNLVCDFGGNCVWLDAFGHYHQYTVIGPDQTTPGAALPIREGEPGAAAGSLPKWIWPVGLILIGLVLNDG